MGQATLTKEAHIAVHPLPVATPSPSPSSPSSKPCAPRSAAFFKTTPLRLEPRPLRWSTSPRLTTKTLEFANSLVVGFYDRSIELVFISFRGSNVYTAILPKGEKNLLNPPTKRFNNAKGPWKLVQDVFKPTGYITYFALSNMIETSDCP